ECPGAAVEEHDSRKRSRPIRAQLPAGHCERRARRRILERYGGLGAAGDDDGGEKHRHHASEHESSIHRAPTRDEARTTQKTCHPLGHRAEILVTCDVVAAEHLLHEERAQAHDERRSDALMLIDAERRIFVGRVALLENAMRPEGLMRRSATYDGQRRYGCRSIQWRAMSTRRQIQTRSWRSTWSRKRASAANRPGRPISRMCR